MSDAGDEAGTERPSEGRIESFRRVGAVPSSPGLTGASVLVAVFLVLALVGKSGAGTLVAYLRLAVVGAVEGQTPWQATGAGLRAMAAVLWFPLGMACTVALVVGLAQTRGNFAPRTLTVDGGRWLPRLRHMLGRHAAVDIALELCKLGVLTAVAWSSIRLLLSVSAMSAGAGAARLLSVLGATTSRLGLHLVLAMMGLGLADYLLRLARHRARLRQSRADATRALREEEGAPEPKAERRRLHSEWLAEIEATVLHEAELVAVAPGVAAIAIAYSSQRDSAPRLILRRERLLAHRLEAAARAADVPVFIAPELVRMLASVEVGEEIPERAYVSVAEAIARARRTPREIRWTLAQSDGLDARSSLPGGSWP